MRLVFYAYQSSGACTSKLLCSAPEMSNRLLNEVIPMQHSRAPRLFWSTLPTQWLYWILSSAIRQGESHGRFSTPRLQITRDARAYLERRFHWRAHVCGMSAQIVALTLVAGCNNDCNNNEITFFTLGSKRFWMSLNRSAIAFESNQLPHERPVYTLLLSCLQSR